MVNVDATKPLKMEIKLPSGQLLTQPVEYEFILRYCYKCKNLTHDTEVCRKGKKTTNAPPKPYIPVAVNKDAGKQVNKPVKAVGNVYQVKHTPTTQDEEDLAQNEEYKAGTSDPPLKTTTSITEKPPQTVQNRDGMGASKGTDNRLNNRLKPIQYCEHTDSTAQSAEESNEEPYKEVTYRKAKERKRAFCIPQSTGPVYWHKGQV